MADETEASLYHTVTWPFHMKRYLPTTNKSFCLLLESFHFPHANLREEMLLFNIL